MTEPVFPALPGQAFKITKAPHFATRTQRGVSGRELRMVDQPYPVWEFTLTWDYLRDKNDLRAGAGIGPGIGYDELRTLLGFFLVCQGSFQTFLFDDPTDDTVVGTGGSLNGVSVNPADGGTTQFQLGRQLVVGGFIEPIVAPNSVGHVYVNGVDPGGWTINAATGVATLASPPAGGEQVTWSGSFYFRCRFSEDAAEADNFMYQLWQMKQLKFRSVLA